MKAVKTITHLKCQICEKQGLLSGMPKKGNGRRVVVCSNEFVTHYKAAGKDYLVRHQPREFPEFVSLN